MIRTVYRVMKWRTPRPKAFLSQEAEGLVVPAHFPPYVKELWAYVSIFEQFAGALDLYRMKPAKGKWAAVLEIPDDASDVEWHPSQGRFGHRGIKADPETLIGYVVDVVSLRDPPAELMSRRRNR